MQNKRIALPKKLKKRIFLIPLKDTLLDYVAIVLSITIFAVFNNLFTLVFSIIITGVFIYRLQIIGHDGLHYSLAENKKLNDFFTRYVLLAPQFTPMSLNRYNHLNHHGRFATEFDADWQYYKTADKDTKPKFYLWLLNVLGFGFVFKIAIKLLSGKKPSAKKHEAAKQTALELPHDLLSIALAQTVIFAVFYFTLGWQYYFIIWVLAVFGVFVPLNTIRSFCEHSIPEPDESKGNRLYTFNSNFFESFILAPHNMNYHFEHHEYMYVPYYHLPALKKLMMKEYRDYVEHIRFSYLQHMVNFFKALPILNKTANA
ncbi:MAG: fatty acid desaturase family protein [Bacteroidia bacterium]